MWNIENDSVKIEYERLQHNHDRAKESVENTLEIAERAVCQKLPSERQPWSYWFDGARHGLHARHLQWDDGAAAARLFSLEWKTDEIALDLIRHRIVSERIDSFFYREAS